MKDCLTTACGNTTKFNYYSNKLDATAWTDFGANPRGKATPPAGSRQDLFAKRSIAVRNMCADKLAESYAKRPQFSSARTAMITNWAFENN